MGFSRQEYWSGEPLPSLSDKLSLVKVLSLLPIDKVQKVTRDVILSLFYKHEGVFGVSEHVRDAVWLCRECRSGILALLSLVHVFGQIISPTDSTALR